MTLHYWPGCSPSSSAAAAAVGGEQGSAAASYSCCPELSSVKSVQLSVSSDGKQHASKTFSDDPAYRNSN